MRISKPTLQSPIEEKIAWAEDFYRKFRKNLLQDKTITLLLNKLKNAVSASHNEMKAIGIADICRECEELDGGSCCGAGLENKYNGSLILINLLLKVRLPRVRYDPESCFFLGKTGCSLISRHVICVNYVCKKITDRIDPREIILLREKEGEELNTLFLLHERINHGFSWQGKTP